MSPKTLILSGDGINCEQETARAFELAGATPEITHLDDFLKLESLDHFDMIAFPGGFSYGDEIRAGKILSEKIHNHQFQNIKKFIQDGKPVLGICNGFQVLTQLGVFNDEFEKDFTLEENDHGEFINKWTECKILDTSNLWLKNMPETIELPIRHKEGKVRIQEHTKFKVALCYTSDINGSHFNIAGISNLKGNVLALMPHPEAAINNLLRPNTLNKTNSDAPALQIFKNAVAYCKERQNGN